jgi:hypothetical protein
MQVIVEIKAVETIAPVHKRQLLTYLKLADKRLGLLINFNVVLEEQKKSTFQYQYSVFQAEYSRNLLFRSGRQMDEIFQALIDRTRAPLNLDRIKTIFGDRNRPHYDKRKKNPTRWGVVVETPTYDLTVFKVHYGKMTLKIYTKGARVLRVEVIVHNTKEYRWGRSLPCFGEIVTRLRNILERFLNAVGCLDAGFVTTKLWRTCRYPPRLVRPGWAGSISTSPEFGG